MHRFEGLVSSNLISLVCAQSGKLKLLLALSGGADSVALLCALKAMASENLCQVYACHVNHGLRGAEADSDQSFCESLCRAQGIALQVVKLDGLKLESSEESLRELRYQALAQVASDLSISHVVTAHTLNDQVETMLFRLCRGTSLSGLTGIKAARSLKGISLLRPLLAIERHELESYLAAIQQSWCVDSSNSDDKYTRNFLRNQIVPQLNQRFSALSQNFEHLRINIERENDWLDLLSAEALERLRQPGRRSRFIAVQAWRKLHGALRARVLVALMRENGVEASFERVERVERLAQSLPAEFNQAEKRYSLGDGLALLFEGGGLTFAAQIESGKSSSDNELLHLRRTMPALVVRLPTGQSTTITVIPWLDKALRVEAIAGLSDGSRSELAYPHRQAYDCLVDLSAISGSLCFRLRQEKDRIQPLGMGQSVRLKQYLHANKGADRGPGLLRHLDERLGQRLTPVLADDQEVLWVPGYGLSQKVRVGTIASHRLSLIDLVRDSGKFELDESIC
jgi:tRNA(Ile)-lysidine synthase